MAGLFFCLASAEGAGLLFCPAAIQPHTSVYSAFCAVHAVYTTHAVKRRAWICRHFPGHLPCFAATIIYMCIRLCCTVCNTLERIATPQHLQHIPDTSATPDAVQASGAAYYNKVYKERSPVMDPCQTVQHTADHSSPAGSAPTACGSLANATLGAPAEGSVSPPAQGQPGGVSILPKPDGLQSGTGQQSRCTGWHVLPGGAVQRQERGGRRGTIGGYRRNSFRAFAR